MQTLLELKLLSYLYQNPDNYSYCLKILLSYLGCFVPIGWIGIAYKTDQNETGYFFPSIGKTEVGKRSSASRVE